MKKLLLEYWNNLIRKYTAKVKKCNIYSLYITLNLCIHPFHTKQFTSYTLTSKCPMYPWHVQKQDFYIQYGETLWKRNLVSFQKIAFSQGASLLILLLTRKANILKIKWKYNCKSISLENEKSQAYKQEKKPFKLKVMTGSLWPKIANI